MFVEDRACIIINVGEVREVEMFWILQMTHKPYLEYKPRNNTNPAYQHSYFCKQKMAAPPFTLYIVVTGSLNSNDYQRGAELAEMLTTRSKTTRPQNLYKTKKGFPYGRGLIMQLEKLPDQGRSIIITLT